MDEDEKQTILNLVTDVELASAAYNAGNRTHENRKEYSVAYNRLKRFLMDAHPEFMCVNFRKIQNELGKTLFTTHLHDFLKAAR